MFATPGFIFRSVRVLDDVGSDHRPLAAGLCLTNPAARAAAASAAARAKAEDAMREIR